MESKLLNYIRNNEKPTYVDMVVEFGAIYRALEELEKRGDVIKVCPPNGVEYYQINKYYECK